MKWIAAAAGILLVLAGVVAGVGATLPVSHTATASARVAATPEQVWTLITDVQRFPEWRPGVVSVRRLDAVDGRMVWQEETATGVLTFGVQEREPPRRLVARIMDEGLPFGGQWTYEVSADGDGSLLRITEDGEVYNPIFRFVSRFVLGHEATIRDYLSGVEAAFGDADGALARASSTSLSQVEEPRFADLWVGRRLDSLYNAEYARLHETCDAGDDGCFARNLDTAAIPLAPVRGDAAASGSTGWLMARLRTSGAYLHASLLYRPDTGGDTVLREDMGDWGYGVTVPISASSGDSIGLRFPGVETPLWLHPDSAPGFVTETYGLEGRLWRLGPVAARRAADLVAVELPRDVFLVLEISEGLVRLRPELPGDMDCGQSAAPDPQQGVVYEVALEQLVDDDGRAAVEVAYGKGC